MNPFGNYLCQKIAENCSTSQIEVIVEKIQKNILKICMNSYGTRAIQKIYEILRDERVICMLNNSIEPHLCTIAQVILKKLI